MPPRQRKKQCDSKYPCDRWQQEIQQLYDDVLQLGITVLEDDGLICRFKCQDAIYIVAWRKMYPLEPPLVYRVEESRLVKTVRNCCCGVETPFQCRRRRLYRD